MYQGYSLMSFDIYTQVTTTIINIYDISITPKSSPKPLCSKYSPLHMTPGSHWSGFCHCKWI